MLPEPHLRLIDGFRAAFDAYLAEPERKPVPLPSNRNRMIIAQPISAKDYLAGLIHVELGDWHDLARAAAEANGDATRVARIDRAYRYHLPFLGDVVMLLQNKDHLQDTLALAKRAAGCIVGPPTAAWQYIAVSAEPAFAIPLFEKWHFARGKFFSDESLPLNYDYENIIGGPADFHVDHSYGVLRRPSGEHDVPSEWDDSEERVLALPLL